MTKTRDNHFVAQWHQKGFIDAGEKLCYLTRRDIVRNGVNETIYSKKWCTPAQQFYRKDLYSTFFGGEVNDDIEQKLFGPIDDSGSKAIRAFSTNDQSQWHCNFESFFTYLDAQKLRTPKGLDWIKSKYPELSQLSLMIEMQSLRSIHCTLWAEGVRELVSAEDSEVKFIVSDHPVTIYNYACPPSSPMCEYPNDPDIALKGSQTIFPLNKNRCLILTNLEFAKSPNAVNPLEPRTNSNRVRQSFVNTIDFINSRKLTSEEVTKINYIIKSRAGSVAAGKEEWLYPELEVTVEWADLKDLLLPPSDMIHRFGGEMYASFSDGSVHYQDAFGRTEPHDEFLNKNIVEESIGRNGNCGCGSGRKYKNCCRNTPVELRTTWSVASIRERNLAFCNCIRDVLGLSNGKCWQDVRRELTNEQISEIYKFYGDLWPRSTDIYALLPKPDGKFRALYSGILDVRVISENALPVASFFDEFLIQTPVTNPNNIRPEFSPTQLPAKYKYQALKEFLFMLDIEPFIAYGLVNLIPDPSDFDSALMSAMLEMAQDRSKSRTKDAVSAEDLKVGYKLQLDDLLNSTAMMPREARVKFLVHNLGLTHEDAETAVSELELTAESSPLVLLQKLDYPESGQFIQFRMGPNYEMALFLAQVTGSILVTDSSSRWHELITAQHRDQGVISYPWNSGLGQFCSLPIDWKFLQEFHKSNGLFSDCRDFLKGANYLVLNDDRDSSKILRLTNQAAALQQRILQAHEHDRVLSLEILSPGGGLYDASVQRLLVRSSCMRYEKKVTSVYGIALSNINTESLLV